MSFNPLLPCPLCLSPRTMWSTLPRYAATVRSEWACGMGGGHRGRVGPPCRVPALDRLTIQSLAGARLSRTPWEVTSVSDVSAYSLSNVVLRSVLTGGFGGILPCRGLCTWQWNGSGQREQVPPCSTPAPLDHPGPRRKTNPPFEVW